MNNKILFQTRKEKELFNFLKSSKKRKSLNFLNQHDIYQAEKIGPFRNSITGENSLNFIDGFVVSIYLSLKNLRKIRRIRGPGFTKKFLSDETLSAGKKHFFIGPEKKDLVSIKERFPHLKRIQSYNPEYIMGIEFPKKEIKKITKKVNNFKPDYIWVGIASPKQNILSDSLFKKINARYIFNVGAALDFLLGKKKEAPKWVRNMGIEWFYRLVTDFKYSKRKVWRSFIGLIYLLCGRVKLGVLR